MAWDWPGYKQVPSVTAGGTQPVETEIDRLRAELAKFDGMLPVPAEDANDLDDVIRELGIEDSFTTPADAVRELKADLAAKDARIAALEAAGNRLGDAAVDGVLTSIEAVTELAEWKEQFRVLAILEQQKTAELAEAKAHIAELEMLTKLSHALAERDAMRGVLQNIVHGYFEGTASRLDGGYSLACLARAALASPKVNPNA